MMKHNLTVNPHTDSHKDDPCRGCAAAEGPAMLAFVKSIRAAFLDHQNLDLNEIRADLVIQWADDLIAKATRKN